MSRLIAMDIETSGELFNSDGRILCCGAYGDGISKVFNFDIPGDVSECAELLNDKNIDIIFHNCIYDTSWLYIKYNMNINGCIHDTMTRASLINEYDKVLNVLEKLVTFGVFANNSAGILPINPLHS